MATVHSPQREAPPFADDELLIREARRRARRRRWIISLLILAVVAATILLVTGGQKRGPNANVHLRTPFSGPADVASTKTTPSSLILPGQSVVSTTPVGGETMWVFTSDQSGRPGSGQGIEWTNDGGRRWRNATPTGMNRVSATTAIGQLVAISPTDAWLAGGPATLTASPRGYVWATTDAGRHWARKGAFPLVGCQLAFWNTRDGVCTQSWGAGGAAPLAVAVTHDGGSSWRLVFDNTKSFGGSDVVDRGLPFECDKQLSLTPPSTLWARFWCNASQAMLYRSDNFGHTWSSVNVAQPTPLVSGGYAFSGPIVMSGQRGATTLFYGDTTLVYATSDGGHSFSPVYPPSPPHLWTADVISPTRWRLSWHQEIIATNDAGATWFSLSGNAFTAPSLRRLSSTYDASPASLSLTDGRFGWATWGVKNGVAVLATRNGGATWHQVLIPGTGAA